MNPAPLETTPSASAEPSRKDGDRDLPEFRRLAPPAAPVRFDLLNALLPEWPAQACSWA